jgi:hypothetical protein
MEYPYKIVDFEKYCKDCKYKETNSDLDPCNECLSNTVNLHSEKPVKFEEKDKKGK